MWKCQNAHTLCNIHRKAYLCVDKHTNVMCCISCITCRLYSWMRGCEGGVWKLDLIYCNTWTETTLCCWTIHPLFLLFVPPLKHCNLDPFFTLSKRSFYTEEPCTRKSIDMEWALCYDIVRETKTVTNISLTQILVSSTPI